MSYYEREDGSTTDRFEKPANPTRAQEVEAEIASLDCFEIASTQVQIERLARTLAAEVDALRGKQAEIMVNQSRLLSQHADDTNELGMLTKEHIKLDATITALLEMLRPGPAPNYMDPKYNPSKMPPLTEYSLDCMWHGMRKQTYARACEIAGRTE